MLANKSILKIEILVLNSAQRNPRFFSSTTRVSLNSLSVASGPKPLNFSQISQAPILHYYSDIFIDIALI